MFADFLPQPYAPPKPATVPVRDTFVTAVTLAAPREAVFRLLADIEALPRWAPAFCERLDLERGCWRALTTVGEMFCTLAASERTGVIELFLGAEPGTPELLLPLRVTALPAGGTLVTLTLRRAPGQPDDQFTRQREALLAGLHGLSDQFGPEPPARIESGGPLGWIRRRNQRAYWV